MTHLPFFARMFDRGFQIGCVPVDVLDVIPNNTPIQLLQGIYHDERGNEIITDGELLIRNKWHLWLWIHELSTFTYVEFSIPGNVIWQLHQHELRISCHHYPTLEFWVKEIMKKLKIQDQDIISHLLHSKGSARLLISQDLKELQLV